MRSADGLSLGARSAHDAEHRGGRNFRDNAHSISSRFFCSCKLPHFAALRSIFGLPNAALERRRYIIPPPVATLGRFLVQSSDCWMANMEVYPPDQSGGSMQGRGSW